MNIKEIARLSGVSVSTVSKIINKKDKNISSDTRERVLKIVKEYHYTPYAGIPDKSSQKSFLVALLLDASQDHEHLALLIVEHAREHGYSTIVCRSSGPEEEFKNISAVCGYNLDGVFWDRRKDTLEKSAKLLEKKGIPCQLIDFYSPCTLGNACIDYGQLGYAAAKQLTERKHTKILCAVKTIGYLEEAFIRGVQRALLEHKIPVNDEMVCVTDQNGGGIPNRYLFEYTGAVCFTEELAAAAYELSARKNRRIPKYLSVVSVRDKQFSCFQPALSTVLPPYEELARYVCSHLVAKMEGKRVVEVPFSAKYRVLEAESVDVPLAARKQRVVVVGSINMDTLLALRTFPKMGETTPAGSITVLPGGKGLNQAVGVSKLGMEAYLIGKVGKDYEGSELFDYLKSNEIGTEGVSNTSKAGTGHAYVHVQSDGESGIVIYDGANGKLSSHDISQNIQAFKNASFCLLQTEIELEAVEYAAYISYRENVKILLKPAAVSSVSDELVQKVFVFLPNEKEIDRLCPFEDTYEGKAEYFLKKGAKHVIITLGSRGCYWSDGKKSRYFEAARFNVVDTTGAADAFAAALAVYLTKGFDMESAIQYSTFAAGFSTTKLGASTAMIDHTMLEFYMPSGETRLEIMGDSARQRDNPLLKFF